MLAPAADSASRQIPSFFDDSVKLITAVVWPALILILLLVYRKGVGELLTALTTLAKNADEIKIWQVEVKRDIAKVLDRTAEHAATEASPPLGVSKPEVRAAQQVSTLVSGSPNEAAQQQVVKAVFQQMLSLAREYESTRANMKPGRERTAAMNAVVAKMRALGPTAKEFLPEFTSNQESPGVRLAGIAVLEMSPDEKYLNWLAERMAVEQPFVFFHAAIALLAAVRFYGGSRREALKTALNGALSTLRSFPGKPDENTLQALETALQELG
jgi:hypothetical protein